MDSVLRCITEDGELVVIMVKDGEPCVVVEHCHDHPGLRDRISVVRSDGTVILDRIATIEGRQLHTRA